MAKYVEVLHGDEDYIRIRCHENGVDTIQKWPRVAPLHVLQTLIHENAAAYEAVYESPTDVQVRISVDELEICYESMGYHSYKLLGVQHYKHIKEGWINPGNEGHERLAGELIRVMPGLKATVQYPCGCSRGPKGATGAVQRIIIHLNDAHHPTQGDQKHDPWDRERIAQWTETLDVDLTVDTSRPKPTRKPLTMSDAQKAAMHKAMLTMTVDTSSITKSLKEIIESSDKASIAIKNWAGKVVELEIKDADPKTYKMLTGLPWPGDNKEEA